MFSFFRECLFHLWFPVFVFGNFLGEMWLPGGLRIGDILAFLACKAVFGI